MSHYRRGNAMHGAVIPGYTFAMPFQPGTSGSSRMNLNRPSISSNLASVGYDDVIAAVGGGPENDPDRTCDPSAGDGTDNVDCAGSSGTIGGEGDGWGGVMGSATLGRRAGTRGIGDDGATAGELVAG